MLSAQSKLIQLLSELENYIQQIPEEKLSQKPAPDKWSNKEILGHLVDSALNNLQRFTEIQFTPRPYVIRKYAQDDLVRANDYQHADTREILQLLIALNTRIIRVMDQQTEEMLAYEIEIEKGQTEDLRFWNQDYVDHFEHHLRQIKKKAAPTMRQPGTLNYV
ncbi:DinB family protein [Reichenbachiella ulvae]|uniref:DinB family protein n=1 Tax=Reichenbachiella ulvae TaxID=2980104 RepID=A0ABT3CVF3_9BACT|nr:DinB family protein [Reichenbachiella ulvae]MCV9387648.1 DinB family protein [Reichenbachiella ulvae]